MGMLCLSDHILWHVLLHKRLLVHLERAKLRTFGKSGWEKEEDGLLNQSNQHQESLWLSSRPAVGNTEASVFLYLFLYQVIKLVE